MTASACAGTVSRCQPPVTPGSGVRPFDAPIAEPNAAGRTGRVAAGCVFWMHATESTFSTVAEDHGNCSVGMLTHGFASLNEVAGRDDVAAIVEAGWVSPAQAAAIPVVAERPHHISYGPLGALPEEPDVVLIRVNGRQLMLLHDAVPGLRIEGKPQCHIVAIAKEDGVPAASVGCALSRVRTGMSVTEMTCAIPASKLGEVVASIERNALADNAVARYAADDARRFA